jgi:hypothetical protein
MTAPGSRIALCATSVRAYTDTALLGRSRGEPVDTSAISFGGFSGLNGCNQTPRRMS